MPLLVFGEDALRTVILFGNHAEHLVVHNLSRRFGVRFLEAPLIVVVIADVGEFVAHSGVGNHAVHALCHTLQVVDGARGDMSREEFLGSPAAEQRANLVEHSLLCRNLPLFRHIPRRAECPATRHDRHLNQRVGVFGEP